LIVASDFVKTRLEQREDNGKEFCLSFFYIVLFPLLNSFQVGLVINSRSVL
jgi:hypothetical protein